MSVVDLLVVADGDRQHRHDSLGFQVRQEGASLGVVALEPLLDRLGGVVSARDDLAAAAVAPALDLGGVEIAVAGGAADTGDLVRLPGLESRRSEPGEITGIIIAIDHFGNLITNITEQQLQDCCAGKPGRDPQIRVGDQIISGLSSTYESVASQKPLALIGSRGYLEIAINSGSAEKHLNAQKGDGVTVVM